MRKSYLGFGLMLVAMLFSVGLFALTAKEPPEVITLGACMDKKAAVEFPHKVHFDTIECTTCHHTQEGLSADSDMEVESCGSCHLEPEDEGTPACSEMSTKKNPYHIKCVSCHKEQAAGPTKCDECHPKAEG